LSSPFWKRLARIGCANVGSSSWIETKSPALSLERFQPAPISGPSSLSAVNAVVRRVLGVAGFGRHDRDGEVEAERADAPGITGLQLRELSDLCHAILLSFVVR